MTPLTALLLTGFGFNIGQIITRISYLDGSLDKPWLLLPIFWFPPLSFIPGVLIWLNKVEKGKTGSPFEYSMLFAIISAILLPILLNKFEIFDGYKGKILKNIIMYMTVYLSLYYRENNICKEKLDYFRLLRNTSIVNLTGVVMPFIIGMMPIINFITMIESDIIDGILKGLSYMFIILILNMYQGTYLDSYCNDTQEKIRIIGFTIVSIIISIIFT